MITINTDLLNALSVARGMMERAKRGSSCNIKQVGAAFLAPYGGGDFPSFPILGVPFGIFTGTNQFQGHNCKSYGADYCPAGRFDPGRLNTPLHSEMRRLRCVNKFCAEVQAAKNAIAAIEEVYSDEAPLGVILEMSVLYTSEFPCARCVDWFIRNPIGSLVFDGLNENANSNAWADHYTDLIQLTKIGGVDVYKSMLDSDGSVGGLTLQPAKSSWNSEAPNPNRFPENGDNPYRSCEARLTEIYELHPDLLPAG